MTNGIVWRLSVDPLAERIERPEEVGIVVVGQRPLAAEDEIEQNRGNGAEQRPRVPRQCPGPRRPAATTDGGHLSTRPLRPAIAVRIVGAVDDAQTTRPPSTTRIGFSVEVAAWTAVRMTVGRRERRAVERVVRRRGRA